MGATLHSSRVYEIRHFAKIAGHADDPTSQTTNTHKHRTFQFILCEILRQQVELSRVEDHVQRRRQQVWAIGVRRVLPRFGLRLDDAIDQTSRAQNNKQLGQGFVPIINTTTHTITTSI
jgi:hypothetical protein